MESTEVIDGEPLEHLESRHDELARHLEQLDDLLAEMRQELLDNDAVLEGLEEALQRVEQMEHHRDARRVELAERRTELWERLMAIQVERDALKADEEAFEQQVVAIERERGDLPERHEEAERIGQRLEQELAEAMTGRRRLAEELDAIAEVMTVLQLQPADSNQEAAPSTEDQSAEEVRDEDIEEMPVLPADLEIPELPTRIVPPPPPPRARLEAMTGL